MKSASIISGCTICLFLLLASCSPRIYRPPALGAEYQFDRGMPSAKKPSHLFDKKTRETLQEKGILEGRSHPPAGSAHAKATNPSEKPAASDSARMDSLTTPAPVTSPTLPDSSHNGHD